MFGEPVQLQPGTVVNQPLMRGVMVPRSLLGCSYVAQVIE